MAKPTIYVVGWTAPESEAEHITCVDFAHLPWMEWSLFVTYLHDVINTGHPIGAERTLAWYAPAWFGRGARKQYIEPIPGTIDEYRRCPNPSTTIKGVISLPIYETASPMSEGSTLAWVRKIPSDRPVLVNWSIEPGVTIDGNTRTIRRSE